MWFAKTKLTVLMRDFKWTFYFDQEPKLKRKLCLKIIAIIIIQYKNIYNKGTHTSFISIQFRDTSHTICNENTKARKITTLLCHSPLIDDDLTIPGGEGGVNAAPDPHTGAQNRFRT